jgi:cytoskeleton protein RodZ
MSTEELGKALTEARIARGLTLHDVERDTRISSKYLQALEEGHLEELPAPVYARAFMRTYAQYLGLNASALVQRLPGAKPELELPPLPKVGRDATGSVVSASWLVASGVVALVLLFGLLIFWNRGGGGEESVTGRPAATEQVTGQGSEQQPTPAGPVGEPDVTPGVVPALERQHVLVAVEALKAAQLRYLIVEVKNDDVPTGIVFEQSPTPGSEADSSTVVTLVVSR